MGHDCPKKGSPFDHHRRKLCAVITPVGVALKLLVRQAVPGKGQVCFCCQTGPEAKKTSFDERFVSLNLTEEEHEDDKGTKLDDALRGGRRPG